MTLIAPDSAAASEPSGRADPFSEIRLTALSATRGANYWSRRPVTRLDLMVGAYDDISSAHVADFSDRLAAALPGLEEHRCSIGVRGGFITRLNRGTYAPHIIEHVALELQTMVGHDVGYGRSRGGDVEGEYTVVFEHQHEATGLRAAALALDIVQQAFAGTLATVDHAVAELKAIASWENAPPVTPRVLCGITGGSARTELRAELARRHGNESALIVDVSPGYILHAGLPYAESDMAVVMDTDLTDVPVRYRDPERSERLVSVIVDGLRRRATLVVPSRAWSVQDYARDDGCRVDVFSGEDDMTFKDKKIARSAAWVADGRVLVEHRGRIVSSEPLRSDIAPAVQAAAALAERALNEVIPNAQTVR